MENKSKSVVFIGAGNVATSFSNALKGTRNIIQVYSHTLAHAKALGKKLNCSYTNDLKKIVPDAGLYIIAVKDNAIINVCKKLSLPGKLVIHTSGSTDIQVLQNISNKNGVIWPMYSFTGKANLSAETPFFIEASDSNTKKELTALVKELKGKPYYIDSEKRLMLHMTAVFVNNFPNHLFTIAEAICREVKIPLSLFFPLAQETINNLEKQSPALSQTGPASRNDTLIIKKHLALLSEDKKLEAIYKDVYKVLTKSIIKTTRDRRKKL